MKIYTRSGDDGSTSLYSGERVSKTSLRVEACGTLDELNCAIGATRAASPAGACGELSRNDPAPPFLSRCRSGNPGEKRPDARITPVEVEWLETEIDRMTRELPPLRNFILPGGTAAAAQTHLARAVCRRAERTVVNLAQCEDIDRNALMFLNRLSDFLFVLARYDNFLRGAAEEKWISGN